MRRAKAPVRMATARAAATAGAVVVALALLAACTTDRDGTNPATAPTGGTLRVGITEPGSVDPGNAYEPSGMLINSLLCEPLLTIDPATGDIRPGLAANWVISDGGRRLTLRLRKARFSNGERVTSDDVIASLSRAASEEFAGNTAELLEPVDGWPEANGRVETKHDRDRRTLRGLTAIDGSSLSVDLARRDADFLRVLAHPVAAPVPRNLIEDDTDALAARPVCAGPYQLGAPWAPGQPVIRLVRNPHYHGRNPVFTAGGEGYADTVEFHISPDPAEAWRTGAVDLAAVPTSGRSSVPASDLHERPNGYIEYIGLPAADNSPYKDSRARRALSAALERSVIAGETGRVPATGFLPGAACPTRGEAVERISDEPLKLYFNDEFDNRATVEAVARQWREKLGLDVRPTAVPFDRVLELGSQPGGVDGAFRFGWQPPVPRPDAYLGPLFTAAGIGRDNMTRFVNADFDRLLDRDARGATVQADVDLGYRAAAQKLCDEMPMIPVAQGVSRYAVRSDRVGTAAGETLDGQRGWPVLRELYVRAGR